MPYPRDQLDRPDALHDLLGSFWTEVYGDREGLLAFLTALAAALRQAAADLAEARDGRALASAPRRHREEWARVEVTRSALAASGRLKVGGFAVGDGSLVGGYGPEPGRSLEVAFADAALLQDRMLAPGRVLARGVDFRVAGGRLHFALDPFEDPALTGLVEPAGADGTDLRLTLWAHGVEYERGLLPDRYGRALLGQAAADSARYPGLLRAAWDALVGGTSRRDLARLLSAMTGVPLAEGDETVEAVWREADGTLQVATTRAAYRLPAASTALVAEGDALGPLQPLCDALRLAEPRGTPPDWLDALALGPGWLAPGLEPVVLPDRDVALEVEDRDGRAFVSCELDGDPDAAAAFWEEVHRRGLAAGRTLARALDRRPAPYGEPTAASLPATLNPLRFALANFLRQNLVLARLEVRCLTGGLADLSALHAASRLLPPAVALRFVASLTDGRRSALAGRARAVPALGQSAVEARSALAGRTETDWKTSSCEEVP